MTQDNSSLKSEEKEEQPAQDEKEEKKGGEVAPPPFIGLSKTAVKNNQSELRELMEKNLKWSQIIYEQNRRIIRHQFYGTFFSVLKWVIIFGVLGASVWWGWPVLKNLTGQYQSVLDNLRLPGQTLDTATVEKILKNLGEKK